MTLSWKHIRHFLIDMDGVLYQGNVAIEPAGEFISWLYRRAITFRLVTNNATLTQSQFVSKLARMGIQVRQEDVFTSSLATALYLKDQPAPAKTAFVIGEDGLHAALKGQGFQITRDKPGWVVVGLDRQVTYEKLATAMYAINQGAQFIGSNPDTSLPTERGLMPGAGSLQAALVAATGVHPVVIGKPNPLMFQLSMQQLGATPNDTVMVGDRLDTDIQGANAVGLPSILVLTGVSTDADIERTGIRPSVVVPDLREVMQQWDNADR